MAIKLQPYLGYLKDTKAVRYTAFRLSCKMKSSQHFASRILNHYEFDTDIAPVSVSKSRDKSVSTGLGLTVFWPAFRHFNISLLWDSAQEPISMSFTVIFISGTYASAPLGMTSLYKTALGCSTRGIFLK